MDEKLNPDYLSKHIGKPVEDLQRKVEELFVAQVQKNGIRQLPWTERYIFVHLEIVRPATIIFIVPA